MPSGMVKYGENFYKSLGFAPLPQTFWERSLFVKPATATWSAMPAPGTSTTKTMCGSRCAFRSAPKISSPFTTSSATTSTSALIKTSRCCLQNGANDGFHEAIGDTIALSITPEYLKQIGLLDKVPPPEADIPILLKQALDKVAFLPFGLLIDKWRWQVFSGEIKPDNYNKAWWDLRLKYQGVVPPVERSEADFDPGAKYHVAGNVPYMRYFLADILRVPVLSRHVPRIGIQRPAQPLHVFRIESSWREAQQDARDGPKQAVAGCAWKP